MANLDRLPPHSRSHRPPRTYGPDDPGGSDPILFPTVRSGNAFSTYRDCVLARPNLWSYWPLDDAVGSTTAVDIVGGRDLSVSSSGSGSGTTVAPTFGVAGPFAALPEQTAVLFNGGTTGANGNRARLDYTLTAPESAEIFDVTHAWTVEFYTYPTAAAGNRRLFGYFAATGVEISIINPSTWQATRADDTTGAVGTYTQTAWTLLRITYDGTNIRFYQDGVLLATVASGDSFGASSRYLFLGNNNPTASSWQAYQGRIAHLSLYTEALTDFCSVAGVGGGSDAPAGWAPTADGSGGVVWTDIATQTELDAHVNDTTDAHDASAISADSTTLVGTGTNVQAVLEELDNGIADHLADTTAAHAASAISADSTTLAGTATDVQGVLEELDNAITAIGVAGHSIEDEGTPLTARSKLNFVGSGVTVTDDSGDDASVVTIPGGGTAIGTELDFVQITGPVTVTATADGNSNGTTIITGNSVSYDGSTRVLIEFYSPAGSIQSATAQNIVVNLYEGTTDLGRLANLQTDGDTDAMVAPIMASRFLTPSAGSHTYHIKAWKTSGTASITGGAGGASAYMPAYMRITVA